MNSKTTTDLHVETWGDGTPVVLIHGSLATGAEEWAEQRPLAELGYRLIVPDRRGYGSSPTADGEDFLADAADIAQLAGTGAHLVGHSYGGLGALVAAAQHPDLVLSLTVLESPVAECAADDPAWRSLLDDVRDMWHADLSDREWVVRFLTAVGSDPSEFPPEFLDAAVASVPVFRNGRSFADATIDLDAIRDAPFPKLVVSGGHHAGFDAMSAELAVRIGGDHRVVEGAGHEIQFTGKPLNDELVALWERAG